MFCDEGGKIWETLLQFGFPNFFRYAQETSVNAGEIVKIEELIKKFEKNLIDDDKFTMS